MTQSSGFDFTKFVPGFDFLKNLTPAAGSGGAPAPGWVAPTLDPEELEKRIQELKTVHFWLEQNTKAVAATIQALEVQRMTLSTLKGMNLSFHELAESLKVNAQASAAPFASAAPEAAAPQAEAPAPKAAKPAAKSAGKSSKAKGAAAAGIDPSQWWGALTDQFQHIAHKAMQDMAHSANSHAGAASAGDKASHAKTSSAKAQPAAKKAARKTARPAARKAASKTSR